MLIPINLATGPAVGWAACELNGRQGIFHQQRLRSERCVDGVQGSSAAGGEGSTRNTPAGGRRAEKLVGFQAAEVRLDEAYTTLSFPSLHLSRASVGFDPRYGRLRQSPGRPVVLLFQSRTISFRREQPRARPRRLADDSVGRCTHAVLLLDDQSRRVVAKLCAVTCSR